MHTDGSLKSRIRREAERLGFDRVGVASAGPAPHFEAFARWIADGRHGDMAYLARRMPQRADPRAVFAQAESVLVVGMNYCAGGDSAPSGLQGRFGRYALGREYHAVVRCRLQALLGWLRTAEPSAEGRCFVDTGPVLEKAWGSRTAIGWMGKNTTLISRRLGSWMVLGVVLLNLPLEPDLPAEDGCGTCRRCIDACPTGALVAPYVLDARLCVSYLTIEHRGPIPRRLRPLIGNRIFGCDACQEACPYNRFENPDGKTWLAPAAAGGAADLIPLAGMTDGEFRRRFRNTPVLRATRDGFVRNVVTALGNSGRSEAVPALEKALEDPSPLVRSTAAWALGRLSPQSVRRLLPETLGRERDPLVLEELRAAAAGHFFYFQRQDP